MKKVFIIGGEPATGKTTLMRSIMSRLGNANFSTFKAGTLRGHINHKSKVIIFGVYEDGEIFAGTDRLSMSVINDARAYLQNSYVLKEYADYTLLMEGDRLFNSKFIEVCSGFLPTAVIILEASEKVKKARHSERGDNQNERFLRSRKTKVENIVKKHPTLCLNFLNESEDHMSMIADYILTQKKTQ